MHLRAKRQLRVMILQSGGSRKPVDREAHGDGWAQIVNRANAAGRDRPQSASFFQMESCTGAAPEESLGYFYLALAV